ncbi:MAG: phasin family protein [Hyphomicrobiaceae bacterium]
MMFQSYGNFGKFGQNGLDSAMGFATDLTKGWQAITVEWTDYSKRTVEQNTAAMEKLLAARSLEQAFEVQAAHAKRAYDDYLQQVARLNGIMADLTKQAMKPVEALALKA